LPQRTESHYNYYFPKNLEVLEKSEKESYIGKTKEEKKD